MNTEMEIAVLKEKMCEYERNVVSIHAKLDKLMPAVEAYNTAMGMGKFVLFLLTIASIGIGILFSIREYFK